MFTDTHCHITNSYYDNIEKVIENAKNNKIVKVINNSSSPEDIKEVIDISKRYKNVYCALGYHPESIGEITEDDMDFLERHLSEATAIGEIGLDYHYGKENREAQIRLFESQLALAEKYHLPVIVHSRDATEDTIISLKKFPNLKGSIHCFSGSLEVANIYIKMGFKLGFGGVVTFKNAKIKEVIKSIPDESILLETDSPYLSPEPVRGTKNEPMNVLHIAKFIAEEKGISLEELSKITEKNVSELFDI